MKRIILIVFISILGNYVTAQEELSFKKITDASRLLQEATLMNNTKPIHAEKKFNEARIILDSILIKNKKYKTDIGTDNWYEFGLWYKGSMPIWIHSENENEDAYYVQKYALGLNIFNYENRVSSNYATSKNLLEKLEDYNDYGQKRPFTLVFEILPYKDVITKTTSSYGLLKGSFSISINIKIHQIIEIKIGDSLLGEQNREGSEKTNKNITQGENNLLKIYTKNKNNIYPGDKNTDGGTKVDSGYQKNQGIPNEKYSKDNYYDKSSDNKGFYYKLSDRSIKSLPKPNYNVKDEGVVVVSIWVDKIGNVTKVQAGARGTTTTSPILWKLAEEAAMRAKFAANPNAPDEQKGTITYNFINF